MATKNNPGVYDCYEKAHPDEPMFVLLARDPVAPILVEWWVSLRRRMGGTEEQKLAEAEQCAASMREWLRKSGKDSTVMDPDAALLALCSTPPTRNASGDAKQ